MLKFINRTIAFQWIILLALLALSIYNILTKTEIGNVVGSTFLYQSFAQFFSKYEYFGKGIIIAALLVQILFLQYHFMKKEYVAKKSVLPACFYLIILWLTKSLIIISPFFFTLLFFLIIISIDYNITQNQMKNNAIWIGFLVAFATCLDVSAIIVLVLIIVTLIINQFSKIREIGIVLFGFGLIYFYFFSYYFLTNQLIDWIETFQQIRIGGILNSEITLHITTKISLATLCIIYLYFMVRVRLISELKVILQRKRIITLNIWAIIMLACLFITNSAYPFYLGYFFALIAIYLAILAQESNPLYINELITISVLVALWL